MQNWLVYGLLASLFWGSYIVAAKVASSEKYYGINPFQVSLFMLVGVAIVFIATSFWQGFSMPESKAGTAVAVFAGVLWASGMTVSLIALQKGADVARLTPLYNTNTLVAVFLGILLLKELPASQDLIKVLVGSVLIMIGTVLVIV